MTLYSLSDGYIANGAEPWLFPQSKDFSKKVPMTKIKNTDYLPIKEIINLLENGHTWNVRFRTGWGARKRRLDG